MSVESDFAELYKSLETFSEECTIVRKQVRNLYRRVRDEDTDVVHTAIKPPSDKLTAWWEREGRGRPLTIDNFVVRLFKMCEKDVKGRTVVLAEPEAALFGWKREKTVTVFDLMAIVPKLFA
jgi:hypothetical protein